MTQKQKILIVDDEIGPRESLRMILKPFFEISMATNGNEALDLVRNQSIDLVTLDLKMPGLSGIEVLRQIKKLTNEIEVTIISAYGSLKNAQEVIQYGAVEFISKPFNIPDIIFIVNRCLEQQRLRRKLKKLMQEVKNCPAMSNEEKRNLLYCQDVF